MVPHYGTLRCTIMLFFICRKPNVVRQQNAARHLQHVLIILPSLYFILLLRQNMIRYFFYVHLICANLFNLGLQDISALLKAAILKEKIGNCCVLSLPFFILSSVLYSIFLSRADGLKKHDTWIIKRQKIWFNSLMSIVSFCFISVSMWFHFIPS